MAKKAKKYGDIDSPTSLSDSDFQELLKRQKADPVAYTQKLKQSRLPGKQINVRSDTSAPAPKVGGSSSLFTSNIMSNLPAPGTFKTKKPLASTASSGKGGGFSASELIKALTGSGQNLVEKMIANAKAGAAGSKSGGGALAGAIAGAGMPTTPPAAFGKSFDDYLAEAQGQTGVDNSIFNAREEALKSRAGIGEAEIAKIYAQLGNSMATAGSEANTRYAAAQDSAGKNAEATTAAIAAARQGTAAEQAAIAKANGMEDIAPSASQNYAATDATNSISSALASSLSQKDYLQSMGTAQGNYFEGNRAASGFRGAEAQAALRRDLQDQLSVVQEDKSRAVANAKNEANSLAAQRYAADYGQFNDQRSYLDNLDNTAYSRAQQEAESQQSYDLRMEELRGSQAQAKAEAEASAQKNMPAYAKIQAQLAQAMPEMAAGAMEIIAEAKMNGDTSADNILKKFQRAGMTPQQIRLAYQSANEYFNTYKY